MNSSINDYYYRVIVEDDVASFCFAADDIQEAEKIIDFIEENIDLNRHPAPFIEIIRVYFTDDTEEDRSEHTEPAAPLSDHTEPATSSKPQQAAGVYDALSKLSALKPTSATQ